ncbi:hypothetical protein D8B26_003701 [Coccidioides posadasii str. Silveira]|nr:hypothetical protein D8B26_003701 [Coccidioides posadasii str. Silveira]
MVCSLSSKFSRSSNSSVPEPRAALVLNRFTRSSTIVFATSNVAEILGVTPNQLVSRSFYAFVEECCLTQAARCLEESKMHDTIAYLRVRLRTMPAEYDDEPEVIEKVDELIGRNGYETEGGSPVYLPGTIIRDSDRNPCNFRQHDLHCKTCSTTSETAQSARESSWPGTSRHAEIEAVITCASDGIIVALRRARPLIPGLIPPES